MSDLPDNLARVAELRMAREAIDLELAQLGVGPRFGNTGSDEFPVNPVVIHGARGTTVTDGKDRVVIAFELGVTSGHVDSRHAGQVG